MMPPASTAALVARNWRRDVPVLLASAAGVQQGQPASCSSVDRVSIVLSDTLVLLLNTRRLGHNTAIEAATRPDKYLQRHKHNVQPIPVHEF